MFDYRHRLTRDDLLVHAIAILINGMQRLSLQKFALDHACSRQSQVLVGLAKLKSYGITEDRLLQLNNILENNGLAVNKSTKCIR